MKDSDDRAARWLPTGFPVPDREVIEQLRQSIAREIKTSHAPDVAELALLIALDEAGADLGEVDARAVWAQPRAEREAVFELLAELLRDQVSGS